jgi:hypothetical protein
MWWRLDDKAEDTGRLAPQRHDQPSLAQSAAEVSTLVSDVLKTADRTVPNPCASSYELACTDGHPKADKFSESWKDDEVMNIVTNVKDGFGNLKCKTGAEAASLSGMQKWYNLAACYFDRCVTDNQGSSSPAIPPSLHRLMTELVPEDCSDGDTMLVTTWAAKEKLSAVAMARLHKLVPNLVFNVAVSDRWVFILEDNAT